jgi:uncharacterized repeat protein (TIGR02543 family)
MKHDQGTYAGSGSRRGRADTGRVVLTVLTALALLLLGSVVSVPAASATPYGGASAAPWPADWNIYTYDDGTPITDVNEDVKPSYLDLASGACVACGVRAPTVAWASDGTHAFFRVRVATDITDTDTGGLVGGAFLVQIADVNGVVRAVVGVDGSGASRDYVYVADPVGGVVTRVHEFPLASAGPSSAGVRVVSADDGSGHFFLDFQVPVSVIATVSGGAVTASTPVKLFFGSATAANLTTIDTDFMLGNAGEVDFSDVATVELVAGQYLVTFDSAGGSAVASQTVDELAPAAVPGEPTRTGHTFTGWYTAADDGSAWDFSTPVTGATALFAHWVRDSFPARSDTGSAALAAQTVPRDSGGAALAAQTVPRDAAVTASPDPTRKGFTRRPRPADTITLSAKRTKNAPITYTVRFNSTGGSAVSPQTVEAGNPATEPKAPTRAGFAFDGWYTALDGGQAWDFSTPVEGAMTLYVRWVELDSGANSSGDGEADTHGDNVGGADEDSGSRNDGGSLPNTGNQVPQGVVPGAVLMLLLGLVLMTRNRSGFPARTGS